MPKIVIKLTVLCTCGHIRGMHNEYGTTARTNGPETNKACELCDCWTWKPVIKPNIPTFRE